MSDISIQLHIDKVLPLQTGVSASGNNWSKQEYIGKTLEQYPKTVVFNLFGDAINENPIQEGLTYNVHLDISSRSYVDKNGAERWFTNVSAWKVELISSNEVQPQAAYAQPQPQVGFQAPSPSAPIANNQPNVQLQPQEEPGLPF